LRFPEDISISELFMQRHVGHRAWPPNFDMSEAWPKLPAMLERLKPSSRLAVELLPCCGNMQFQYPTGTGM
jgi:hypothetical protein